MKVAQYPVMTRERALLLYGPVSQDRFLSRPSTYHIILHVPNSKRMFSLLRTDSKKEAEDTFIIFKETFPILAECDPLVRLKFNIKIYKY
jgi:hypothetical protein